MLDYLTLVSTPANLRSDVVNAAMAFANSKIEYKLVLTDYMSGDRKSPEAVYRIRQAYFDRCIAEDILVDTTYEIVKFHLNDHRNGSP